MAGSSGVGVDAWAIMVDRADLCAAAFGGLGARGPGQGGGCRCARGRLGWIRIEGAGKAVAPEETAHEDPPDPQADVTQMVA